MKSYKTKNQWLIIGIFFLQFFITCCLVYHEHVLDPNSFFSNLLIFSKLENLSNPIINQEGSVIFNPPPGVFQTATKLEMTSSIPNAIIHYTLDGTEPTENSPIYTEPISIWRIAGRQIQAILIHPDIGQSPPSNPGGYYSMPPLKTGQFSCFNSSGNPIFCSGTKHDGELQNGTNYSFTSNNDGTVIDNHTGLVWAACTNGHTYPGCTGTPVSENHANAILNCSNSTLAGRTWRLPNYYEYATLSRTGLSTAIDSTYFPNPPYNEQWTNSNRYGSSLDAHTIDFSYNFHQHLVKTSPINFRCVSGEEWTPVDSFEDLGNGSIKDNNSLEFLEC